MACTERASAPLVGIAWAAIGAVTLASPAAAQVASFEVLHRFSAPYEAARSHLVHATDGRLYGLFKKGGEYDAGAVFVLTPDGQGGFTVQILHSFRVSDGSDPAGLIQATNGAFYGTTSAGGANGYGTVFRMNASGVVTTLHDFQGPDGRFPAGGLVQSPGGSFYGTTAQGGMGADDGTIFVMDGAGTLVTLHSFRSSSTGRSPSGELAIDGAGNLYGTTSSGGSSGGGTIFKFTPTGTLTTLRVFGGGVLEPSGLVFANNGLLYGTTKYGGSNGAGMLYSISTTGTFATLRNFCGSSPEGCNPTTTLTLGMDGRLYGTTSTAGPQGGGAVFAITTAGVLAVLHGFGSGTEGRSPETDLMQSTNGNFFGMTHQGGVNTLGTIFEITSAGSLVSVTNVPSSGGAAPRAPLTRGPDGLYYGTTNIGGTRNLGTVFSLDPQGHVTTLHDFIGTDGAYPYGNLVLGNDGYLYGTTHSGGAGFHTGIGYGTVFRMDRSGNLTTLHSFSGTDGSTPYAGLVQGSDGYFYGTTSAYSGGPSSYNGTVFKIDSAGTFTTLHRFTYTDGGFPYLGSLIQASDGYFYGTTTFGGNGAGTVFKIDNTGALTSLHNFSLNVDGGYPYGGLVQGRDGDFYGTTGNGRLGAGSVFKMDSSGVVTTLHDFFPAFVEGEGPQAALVEGANGSFYGVTSLGGNTPEQLGTVFGIASDGTLTNLHNFDGVDGGRAGVPLIFGNDGRLYGTTVAPGGIVFALSVPGASPTTADLAVVATASSSSVAEGASLTYTVTAINNGPATATAVGVTMPVGGGITIVQASSPAGFCVVPIAGLPGNVSCDAGSIPPGGHVVVTIEVQPHVPGPLTATFAVSGREPDPATGNNTATVVTDILPSADMAIQIASPALDAVVQVGAPMLIDVSVSNLGPSSAFVARVRLDVPPTLQNVSASAPNGTCESTPGVVLCDIDNFGAGSNVHMLFTAVPAAFGPITATFVVSTPLDDLTLNNNSAALIVTGGFAVHENIRVADGLNNGVSIPEVVHVVDRTSSSSPAGLSSPGNSSDILDDEIIRVIDRIESANAGGASAGGSDVVIGEVIRVIDTLPPADIDDRETIRVRDSWTFPTGFGTLVTNPNVEYQALDSSGIYRGVIVEFSSIEQAGMLTAEIITDPPPPPSQFVFLSLVFDITTTAVVSGPILVCIEGTDLTANDRLLHYENAWIDLTLPQSSSPTRVCGATSSLSPFVIGRLINRPPTANAGLYPLVVATSSAGAAVALSGSGSDPDAGDTLSFKWTDGTTVLGTSGSVTPIFAIGAHTVTLTVTDSYGASASSSTPVTVTYGVCLLYDPQVAKKKGSAFPIKLQLCDAGGGNLSSPSTVVHAVSVARITSNTPVAVEDAGSANPDFDFRYDAALGGYIFNLKTTEYATGTYRLLFTAGSDAVTHEAVFAIK
jgi:uncharacterized repeat protein (TIGR01451 family)